MQGENDNVPDIKQNIADAVDFFGHKRSKEQLSKQDLTSDDVTKSEPKNKLQKGGLDEDGNRKRSKKRKRSILTH